MMKINIIFSSKDLKVGKIFTIQKLSGLIPNTPTTYGKTSTTIGEKVLTRTIFGWSPMI
jgi:hypothetical protein